MAGDDESVDWRELREFAGVDLAHSFVLTWKFEAGTLFVDSDILLRPDHPFFETPRPAEKVCIRPAVIEFPFCTRVAADGTTGGGDPRNDVEQLGHGAISGMRLCADGRYELRGDFGTVIIDAERPVLRLKGP